MLPCTFLETRQNDHGFSIVGKGDTTIKFIATNLKTAHKWTHDYDGYYPSLSFCCSQKENALGIIILKVACWLGEGKNKSREWKYFILEVEEGKVNLGKFWASQKSNRLIAVTECHNSPDAFIEVISESDKRYTTNPNPASGEYYVPDETLLCRYVVGEVEESVLQEAATLQAEEETAVWKLRKLKDQYDVRGLNLVQLQKKLAIQDENVATFTAKFEQARKTVGAMRDKLDIALLLVGWWQKDLYKKVKSAIDLAEEETSGGKTVR